MEASGSFPLFSQYIKINSRKKSTQKIPGLYVYIGEMIDDIDMLLREYYRWIKGKSKREPTVNYYLLAKYLEGKTTLRENDQVAGMMVDD